MDAAMITPGFMQFVNAILQRGITPTQIVREADVDESGTLDIQEFMSVCYLNLKLSVTPEEIEEVFKLVDSDQSGECDADEIKRAIEKGIDLANAIVFSANRLSDADRASMSGANATRLVALVAHNNMKPSMMNFVAQNIDFFKTVSIVTTGSTGSALENKLGLNIAKKVASGPLGGDQELVE